MTNISQELLHVRFCNLVQVLNHLLFYVKDNQISPTYASLNLFIFLSLLFSNIKISSFFSQGLRGTQS